MENTKRKIDKIYEKDHNIPYSRLMCELNEIMDFSNKREVIDTITLLKRETTVKTYDSKSIGTVIAFIMGCLTSYFGWLFAFMGKNTNSIDLAAMLKFVVGVSVVLIIIGGVFLVANMFLTRIHERKLYYYSVVVKILENLE